MVVSVLEPNDFLFENVKSPDIRVVSKFAHDVSRRTNQAVYVVASRIDSSDLAGAPLETHSGHALIRLGKEEIGRQRFRYGTDVVLWRSSNEESMCELIGDHWNEYWISWAVLIDCRDIADVAEELNRFWTTTHRTDGLDGLVDTVGPQRTLAMVCYDPSWFTGRVVADFWATARALLEEIGGSQLEVYDESVTPED